VKYQPFTFNPFEENTYVLYDETMECIIVDPGCYSESERKQLVDFIETNGLKPVRILLTHTHIDHILGNNFLIGKYNLPIQMCFIETQMLHAAREYGHMWGIDVEPSPDPEMPVLETKEITFGNTTLVPLFTPGHSPGSFSYLHRESKNLFSGDVLFMQSIGRTDLPGGDYAMLIKSIREKLLVLDDDIKVHPGHGPSTTVASERKHNPFLQD
jgi:hydroxyacylglutathione hydrolase